MICSTVGIDSVDVGFNISLSIFTAVLQDRLLFTALPSFRNLLYVDVAFGMVWARTMSTIGLVWEEFHGHYRDLQFSQR